MLNGKGDRRKVRRPNKTDELSKSRTLVKGVATKSSSDTERLGVMPGERNVRHEKRNAYSPRGKEVREGIHLGLRKERYPSRISLRERETGVCYFG